MAKVELSIIVVNWNTRELLAACLESVQRECQSFGPGAVETLVVDNASSDGSVDMVRERFPWVQLIENGENVGFARANNQALAIATGRYCLLLNSDAMVQPDTLAGLFEWAERAPRAGVIGAQLLNPDGSFQEGPHRFPTAWTMCLEAWGLMPALQRNPYYPSCPPAKSRHTTRCDWVSGACLLIRQDALREIGLLDEQFFMNSEEVDLCYRMHQSGWEVWYTPDVKVMHIGGGSANRKGAVQRQRLYAGKVRFVTKHFGPLAGQVMRLNFRAGSLFKVLHYQFRSVVFGRSIDREQAHSHWTVATRRQWV